MFELLLVLFILGGFALFGLLVFVGAGLLLRSKKGPISELPFHLVLPPGWTAAQVAGEIAITLPSSYTFHIRRGDGHAVLRDRVQWLKDTPYRTNKEVRWHDPNVFAYRAREDDLDDVSFVACKEIAGSLWYAETNGAIVEVPEPVLSPELAAEKEAIQAEMTQLTLRGAAMDGPEFAAVLDKLSVHTAKAMVGAPPSKSTSMTTDECDAAIKMIVSMSAR